MFSTDGRITKTVFVVITSNKKLVKTFQDEKRRFND